MSYYFCIVGTRDNLLYEADLTSSGGSNAQVPSTAPTGAGERGGRTSIFGFTSAIGQWTSGLGARDATDVTPDDVPRTTSNSPINERHLLQMIAHGSLDTLEDKQFVDNAVYLKSLDRINDWTVSAFLIPGSMFTCVP